MSFKDNNRLRKQHGASLVEYTLLIALITLVAFAGVRYFGEQNQDSLENSAECITAATNGLPLPANCPQ